MTRCHFKNYDELMCWIAGADILANGESAQVERIAMVTDDWRNDGHARHIRENETHDECRGVSTSVVRIPKP